MSYNLLIYPEGQMVNRIDTLSKILDFYQPDLLMVQELKSAQGLQNITQELNTLYGEYQSGSYIPQVSNPDNSWRLQQNIVFNEDIFELVGEQTLETPYRDVNYFQLRILNKNGTPSNEFLHTYVTHLKSSQGSTNEQLRLSMVEVLMDHIDFLPPESNIIVAGDFNVYSGDEPAYELLLSTNGTNTLNDPIDMPRWSNFNFPHKEIYTQSTRLSSLGDGSGGGLDDRFDFVLLSDHLMNPNANYSYHDESYKALGNNGTCYNQDLIDCTTTNNVPFSILQSLYYMSDHLPIVLSLDINDMVSTTELPLTSLPLRISPNPANKYIEVIWNEDNSIDLQILNVQGKEVLRQELLDTKTTVNIADLQTGLYIIQTRGNSGGTVLTSKLLIQR